MKNKWVWISIIIGVICGIISYQFIQNWKLSLIITMIVTAISLVCNPKLFFARVSLYAFSALVSLHKFFFEATGTLLGIEFTLKNDTTSEVVTIILGIITIISLVFYFLERSGKLKGTFLDFSSKDNKNAAVDITGDGNHVTIIQSNGLERNKEEIVQSYTFRQEEKINELEKRLKDKEKIEGLLDKEVLKLSQELENEKQEKARLQNEVENIIESNKGKDLTKESSIYQQTFKLFLEGNIDKALDKLDDSKLEVREKRTFENRKQEAKLRILKAQLLRVNHNYKDAGKNYEKAVMFYESKENCFEAAYYFQFLNEFKKAQHYYYKCLEKTTSQEEKATTLNNLGNLHSNQNEYENASASYQEALAIRRELASVNPQTYLPDVGMTLINLGNLHINQNEYENASVSYQEGLTMYRELASVNPQTFLPYVATTLNNLGNLQSNQNEYENASASYQEALAIRRELASVNPQTYLPDVGMTLNNLGNLQRDQNEYEKASISYQEALAIYRDLASVNPQTYLPNVATTLSNLGNLQRDQNEYEKASASYQKALAIRRELASVNPQTYLPAVGMTLNNLGSLQRAKNEYEKASASYQEALAIRRELASVNPQTYLPDVGMTLINMSIFYQESKVDKKLSIQYIDEAITILLPFHEIGYIQNYLKEAFKVLKAWEIDVEAYVQEKFPNQEEK